MGGATAGLISALAIVSLGAAPRQKDGAARHLADDGAGPVAVIDLDAHPADDCTIWYVGDYLKRDAANYSTRIGAFRLPGCFGR